MKNILQFWSGGADSTYLLLQNLLAGNKVTATYIQIRNNANKTQREEEALQRLKDDVRWFCKHFGCAEPEYLNSSSIDIWFNQTPYATQETVFTMFAILLGDGYDEVHRGIVVGDDGNGSVFPNKCIDLYCESYGVETPHIETPLQDISKETIYLTLKGYDEVCGTNFLQHITVCEADGSPCDEHTKQLCKPCRTQAEVFKRLGWNNLLDNYDPLAKIGATTTEAKTGINEAAGVLIEPAEYCDRCKYNYDSCPRTVGHCALFHDMQNVEQAYFKEGDPFWAKDSNGIWQKHFAMSVERVNDRIEVKSSSESFWLDNIIISQDHLVEVLKEELEARKALHNEEA
ncbi:MAG: hypothetical protein NC218_01835 [Acetobacter sp.]|nr:hypothetical protein [Acetobacter sp.]